MCVERKLLEYFIARILFQNFLRKKKRSIILNTFFALIKLTVNFIPGIYSIAIQNYGSVEIIDIPLSLLKLKKKKKICVKLWFTGECIFFLNLNGLFCILDLPILLTFLVTRKRLLRTIAVLIDLIFPRHEDIFISEEQVMHMSLFFYAGLKY